MALIIKAADFAAFKHRNQRRKDVDASPYINHPIALAALLTNEAGITDPGVICAALLHDTIEDTETTPAELQGQFGRTIAAVVMEVTDDKNRAHLRQSIRAAPVALPRRAPVREQGSVLA